METINERVARYIDDAIALEASLIPVLDDMAGDALDPVEADMYRNHRLETERQKMDLEARLTALGRESSRNILKDIMNKVGTMATDLLHAGKSPEDKATRNLLQAYAMESLEVAVYEALAVAADAAGDTETASLARKIQREEEMAAKKIMGRISESSREATLAPTA